MADKKKVRRTSQGGSASLQKLLYEHCQACRASTGEYENRTLARVEVQREPLGSGGVRAASQVQATGSGERQGGGAGQGKWMIASRSLSLGH